MKFHSDLLSRPLNPKHFKVRPYSDMIKCARLQAYTKNFCFSEFGLRRIDFGCGEIIAVYFSRWQYFKSFSSFSGTEERLSRKEVLYPEFNRGFHRNSKDGEVKTEWWRVMRWSNLKSCFVTNSLDNRAIHYVLTFVIFKLRMWEHFYIGFRQSFRICFVIVLLERSWPLGTCYDYVS